MRVKGERRVRAKGEFLRVRAKAKVRVRVRVGVRVNGFSICETSSALRT